MIRRKYNEIFRLKKMLEEDAIPFCFMMMLGGFHLIYPAEGAVICSVIEHDGSYGRDQDLLEIQGLMTQGEMEDSGDTVLGYLSAENVFNRIKRQYRSSAKKNNRKELTHEN